jgi:hypothetical protein
VTLQQKLVMAGSQVLTVAQFNSYVPNDGEIVQVVVTGAWASGDAVWQFRYRQTNPDGTPNGNSFKWDFIGGPPIYDHLDGVDTGSFGAGGWADFHTGLGPGPQFNPFPLHGQFIVRFGAAVVSSADGQVAQVGVSVNGADPANPNRAQNNLAHYVAVSHASIMNFSIGDNVKMEYQCDSGSASFQLRWMEITPTRVSSG